MQTPFVTESQTDGWEEHFGGQIFLGQHLLAEKTAGRLILHPMSIHGFKHQNQFWGASVLCRFLPAMKAEKEWHIEAGDK